MEIGSIFNVYSERIDEDLFKFIYDFTKIYLEFRVHEGDILYSRDAFFVDSCMVEEMLERMNFMLKDTDDKYKVQEVYELFDELKEKETDFYILYRRTEKT